ncbi:MAG: hypothetical protein VR73_11845 [Gammaproteobacteria bacterium BRH_c0]|nr:MAG: hypothetical protein VR73_11845 [Gammaproteobacteria bacterium BRH_c0]
MFFIVISPVFLAVPRTIQRIGLFVIPFLYTKYIHYRIAGNIFFKKRQFVIVVSYWSGMSVAGDAASVGLALSSE